jgi:hypothetical protein
MAHFLDNDSKGEYGPIIKKTNSHEVQYGKDYLKHHDKWPFEPIYVVLDQLENLTPAFGVNYQITAANLPDPVTGRLLIHLEIE